ncbi:MAG TPA: LytR C-terminal domain-containing protein [Candidatus Sulfotelmatobacter sp.]|nr:LytR C-terminal domain-containing protein [Candidatus Sulfotelmatobacter sp.]
MMGNLPALLGFSSQLLIIIVAFGIIFLSAIFGTIYFYIQYQHTQDQLNKSTQADDQAALIIEVGKLIVLPTGEQPNIATVSDITKLQRQPFFLHARNGDKVLVYPKAQEAILYDPMISKIVEVGPVAMTQATPTMVITPTLAPIKVALYNGTTTVGLTATMAKELKKKMPNVTVISRDSAQNASYGSIVIVDLTGKNASQASIIAKKLNGNVENLPIGEKAPKNADILIILGK